MLLWIYIRWLWIKYRNLHNYTIFFFRNLKQCWLYCAEARNPYIPTFSDIKCSFSKAVLYFFLYFMFNSLIFIKGTPLEKWSFILTDDAFSKSTLFHLPSKIMTQLADEGGAGENNRPSQATFQHNMMACCAPRAFSRRYTDMRNSNQRRTRTRAFKTVHIWPFSLNLQMREKKGCRPRQGEGGKVLPLRAVYLEPDLPVNRTTMLVNNIFTENRICVKSVLFPCHLQKV